jgi:hypothetical protein
MFEAFVAGAWLASILVAFAVGRWAAGPRRPKHKHQWKRVTASPYDSIVGPRTIIGWRCSECQRVEIENLRGEWTLEALN